MDVCILARKHRYAVFVDANGAKRSSYQVQKKNIFHVENMSVRHVYPNMLRAIRTHCHAKKKKVHVAIKMAITVGAARTIPRIISAQRATAIMTVKMIFYRMDPYRMSLPNAKDSESIQNPSYSAPGVLSNFH